MSRIDAAARFASLSFLAALVMSFCIVPGHAQVTGATLSGTVTDPSGAVIPNVQVSIRNTSTGITRNAKTDASGLYNAPNLLPGSYSVSVSAPGFSTQARGGILLTVGGQQVLNVSMQVGKVTNVVQVMGAPPQVQLATSSIGAVVNSTTVRQLPLNGRSWSDLAKLQPGVDAIVTQRSFASGAGRGTRGFGNQITISGQRPIANNYRLDGVSLNDYANGGPGSVLGGNLGVDAIQEFSVLTTNYSAEYGKTAGGVINAITKSGTNQFHGDAYEFLRNDALDAANFFDNFTNAAKPPFRRNQFGVSAGGPIQRDKTFIFGDYEGVRQTKGISTVDTVFSPAARLGNLTTGTVTVDPSAQKYLGFYPLPNGTVSGDTGVFGFAASQVVREDYWTTRVDHTFSNKDSLFGTYMFDVTPYTSPDGLNNVLLHTETNRQFVVLEETHIFSPTLVNSVRAGYNRDGVADNIGASAINPLASDPSLGALPGENAAAVEMPAITSFAGGVLGNDYDRYFWNSFQGYDDAFYTRGTHSIKFGGVVERMDLNTGVINDPSGNFTFATIADFLTNHPSRFNAGFLNTLTRRGLRQTLFGAYLQDDWRARPNLTLNLGLRWEMITVPTEVQGKLANLLTIYDAKPHLGSPLYQNPTHKNFEPRVGFAWDPFHNGKMAVRGGFGFFDVLPLPVEFILMETTASPFFLSGNAKNLPAGSFYTGAAPLLSASASQNTYIPQGAQRNYMMQYNFNVQRQLGSSLTATVAYVGSRGIHNVFRADDFDMVVPTLTPAGYLFPNPAGSGTVFNPNFGSIREMNWAGWSFYNGLEARLTKTMSHGVQLEGSFTWGKSIDTGSSTEAGDQFSNSISSLPFYSLSAIQGLSDFNIARTLVVNAIWDVPTPKSWTGFRQLALGGWELGGIFTASDGVPFAATWGTNGDPQG
ncbi:MAG: carboxypeptidase regulatory-like domain-containing protein, partial [Terriglobia bacterium]